MEDQTKPPYPLGDLTPGEIEQLRQSKIEISKRVKELWEKENQCCDEPRGFVGGVCDNCEGIVKEE